MEEGRMEEQRHSGLGIASFIIGIASAILMFLLIVVAGALEASTPGGMDEESAAAVIVGLFLILFLLTSVVAFGLGVAGLFQRDRKKVFPVLGTVFSSVTVLGSVMLVLVGLMAS
ncbi:MAG: DUF6142 family protein [Pseudomonadota bacterium]